MADSIELDNVIASLKIVETMNVRHAKIFYALGVTENGSVAMVLLENPLISSETMGEISIAIVRIMEEAKRK